MSDLAAIYQIAQSIPGWLMPEEAARLYQLGLSAEGDVLEIGTYFGRSTFLIARGLKDAGRQGCLITVDLHVGADGSLFTPEPPAFLSNTLKTHELHGLVVQAIGWSRVVVPHLDFSTIGAVFINGGHEFEVVRDDYQAVRKELAHRTMLLFHHYNPEFPGVRRAIDEHVKTDPTYTEIEVIQSLLVCWVGEGAMRSSSAEAEIRSLRQQLADETAARCASEDRIDELLASTSWQVTGPMRWAMDRFRGRKPPEPVRSRQRVVQHGGHHTGGTMLAYDLNPDIDKMPSRRRETFPEIVAEDFWAAYTLASPYSILHVCGFYNLYQSIHYILDNDLPGDFVECGCALGGAAIFMARILEDRGARRTIHLFDTFAGPPAGTNDSMLGKPFTWNGGMPYHRQATEANIVQAVGSLRAFQITEGLVEETLPKADIGDISLLRLDTDFYDSTLAEFTYLYPKLVRGGALIVDDYGIFAGSRRATDEYLKTLKPRPLLNKVDVYVWAGVKP